MKKLIKVKIADIVNSTDALKELVKMPLKAKTAYHVARLGREVEKEYNLFQEKRMDLVKKYAIKDENGEPIVENEQISVAPENIETFKNEINELAASEVELNVEKIKLDDLNCDLRAEQISRLMEFIEE